MRDAENLERRELLVPIRGADPDRFPPAGLDVGTLSGAPEDPVQPVVIDRDGRSTLLLFTSADAARRWRPSVSAISARGNLLVALAERMGVAQVVADVAGPALRTLAVIDEQAAAPPGEGTWRVRGLAGPLEPGALHRLRRRLAGSPAVASAHVVEATDPRSGADMLVLALAVPGVSLPATEAVARDLLVDIVSLLPGRLYDGIQVTVIDDPEFRDAVRSADAAVYERP